MYDEYFASVANIFNGGRDWYEPNPDRTDLNWFSECQLNSTMSTTAEIAPLFDG